MSAPEAGTAPATLPPLFAFTAEHTALREVLRKFFAARAGIEGAATRKCAGGVATQEGTATREGAAARESVAGVVTREGASGVVIREGGADRAGSAIREGAEDLAAGDGADDTATPADTDDPTAWRALLGDIGVDDMLFDHDGAASGSTPVDLAILAEEAGAALYGGPLLPAALLGVLLGHLQDEQPALAARLLRHPRAALDPAVLDSLVLDAATLGSAALDPAALDPAVLDPAALDLEGPGDRPNRLTVRRGPSGPLGDGTVAPVWHLAGAEAIMCAASVDGVPGVVVLTGGTGGVGVGAVTAFDPSRPLGRLECQGAAVELVVTEQAVVTALRRRGRLLVAAELLGVAQRAFDRTVDHVAHRVQFGRTIGSFQAVKHRLADLLTQVELTRSAVYGAAWRLGAAREDPRIDGDLAVAAALAADTATTVTKAAVQLHGGIAITWEHWAHRYLRRAHAMVALTGSASDHRRRLAELVDLEGRCI
ncbi:acyl-CoA dehydrogenase family protein [Nocardia otitidiscaviarum]|uniref:acyl-CoA dehydrogenase family protein n=1 Tax=Nocardia otitidiscaviarum TaxID=1823 RepID=UPI0004A76E86|nr:acyl-CoA dehydrogenase family protein [Nocardia otitidiscaviarum]